MTSGRMWRHVVRTLFVAVALLLTMAVAGPADAHNVLIRTSPAAGSTVAKVPARIVLTFDEPGQAGGTVIAVTGPSGNVSSGPAELVDSDVDQPIAAGSPAGEYTVDWRVVSADGHPVTGSFSFTAGAASDGTAPATSPGTATSSGTGESSSHLVLWLVLALILIAAAGGVVAFARRSPDRHADGDDDD